MWNGYNHTSVHSFTVPLCFYTYTNCSGTIYDTGGANGNYGKNEDYHLIIQPTGANQVQFNFNTFHLHTSDTLWAYNGSVSTTNLLGIFTGNQIPPTITANSGTMIIRFKSDFLNESVGWSANWNCILNTTSLIDLLKDNNNLLPYFYDGNIYIPKCEDLNLFITDMLGKKIYSMNEIPTQNPFLLPMKDYPSGIYVIHYSCNEKKYITKFYKE
jgi:hypothetical protein